MSVVLVKGRLYGLKGDADCEVIAWRPTDNSTCYSQMRVVEAALDLPDSKYTFVVDGRVYSTEKCKGWWQMVHAERATA
jgi:hypothetical protein